MFLKIRNSERRKEKIDARILIMPSGKRKGKKMEKIKGNKDRSILCDLIPSEETPKYHIGRDERYPKVRHQEIHRGLFGFNKERERKTRGIMARRYTSRLGFPFPCDNGLMVFDIIDIIEAKDRGFKSSAASIHFSPRINLITPSLQKNIGAKKVNPTNKDALM